jgi:serine/threonine protein kinase
VKCVNTHVIGNTFIVTTTPICDHNVKKYINNEKDLKIFLKCLLESIHSIHQAGYSHNDIRFANILYDPYHPFDNNDPSKGRFLLTDFERVRRLCNSRCKINHKTHSTTENDYEFIRNFILKDKRITNISSSIALYVSKSLNNIPSLLKDLDQLN